MGSPGVGTNEHGHLLTHITHEKHGVIFDLTSYNKDLINIPAILYQLMINE